MRPQRATNFGQNVCWNIKTILVLIDRVIKAKHDVDQVLYLLRFVSVYTPTATKFQWVHFPKSIAKFSPKLNMN